MNMILVNTQAQIFVFTSRIWLDSITLSCSTSLQPYTLLIAHCSVLATYCLLAITVFYISKLSGSAEESVSVSMLTGLGEIGQ